ncbi:MAG: tetratricopeptide repeat protein [Bacteroidales bacterium]
MKKIIIITIALFALASCTNKEEKAKESFNQGLKHLEKNQYDAALSKINQAIEYSDDDQRFYLYRGNIYLNKKKYNKAIQEYDQAIKIDSTYAKAWLNKGNAVFYETGNKDEACPFWLKAQEYGKENLMNKIKGCPGFSMDMVR